MNLQTIKFRHDAVSFFITEDELRRTVRGHLRACGDMGRAVSRIALERGGPRDLRAICDTLSECEIINSVFAQNPNLKVADNIASALDTISQADKPELAALRRDIDKAFTSDVPMLARDGGYVCLLYTSPSPRDGLLSRMPSSA